MASDRDRIRHVVVGVGINVNTPVFPDELHEIATSLRIATGKDFDRGALLTAFLNAFEPAYEHLIAEGSADALEEWRSFARLGHRCRVEHDGRILEGIAADVDTDGALKIQTGDGSVHRLLSGEIF